MNPESYPVLPLMVKPGAHLDTPSCDSALQQLGLWPKAAQQVPVLIHGSHCMQVVMQQSAQGHLHDQAIRQVRRGEAMSGEGEVI